MSGAITGLDWSLDSKSIRASSGAGEVLVFEIDAKGGRKRDTHGEIAMAEKHWATHTVKRGFCTEGIYPSGEDGSHINDVNWCKNKSLIFTGDDWGLLNVYRNPVRIIQPKRGKKKAAEIPAKMYRAHSEHVMRVAIEGDNGERVFTVGGQDQCLIQWAQEGVGASSNMGGDAKAEEKGNESSGSDNF